MYSALLAAIRTRRAVLYHGDMSNWATGRYRRDSVVVGESQKQ